MKYINELTPELVLYSIARNALDILNGDLHMGATFERREEITILNSVTKILELMDCNEVYQEIFNLRKEYFKQVNNTITKH